MTHTTSTDQRQLLAPATDLGRLHSTFAGEILTPADGERYDDARVVFNAMFDRRPAAIARATCDGDVVAAVLFVQSARLPLAVRLAAIPSLGTPPSTTACSTSARCGRSRSTRSRGRFGSDRASPGVSWTLPPRNTGWRPPAAG